MNYDELSTLYTNVQKDCLLMGKRLKVLKQRRAEEGKEIEKLKEYLINIDKKADVQNNVENSSKPMVKTSSRLFRADSEDEFEELINDLRVIKRQAHMNNVRKKLKSEFVARSDSSTERVDKVRTNVIKKKSFNGKMPPLSSAHSDDEELDYNVEYLDLQFTNV